jgi:hypothetical protein
MLVLILNVLLLLIGVGGSIVSPPTLFRPYLEQSKRQLGARRAGLILLLIGFATQKQSATA